MSILNTKIELFYNNAWVDISKYVYHKDGIQITRGTAEEADQLDPGKATLTLKNQDGRFTPNNARSPLYGYLKRNTPIRISTEGSYRFYGEVASWPRKWDTSGKIVYSNIEVRGLLYRLGVSPAAERSAIRKYTEDVLKPKIDTGSTYSSRLMAYWPYEDKDGSTKASSVVQSVLKTAPPSGYGGSDNASVYYTLNPPSFSENSDVPAGSDPLPAWPSGSNDSTLMGGFIPLAEPPWVVSLMFKCTSNAVKLVLIHFLTTGSRSDWQASVKTDGTLEIINANQSSSDTWVLSSGLINTGWHTLSMHGLQTGSDINVNVVIDGNYVSTLGGTGQTIGTIHRVWPHTLAQGDLYTGHVSVAGGLNVSFNEEVAPTYSYPPLTAYSGEQALDRIVRLGGESQVPTSIISGLNLASDNFDNRALSGSLGRSTGGHEWTSIILTNFTNSVSGGKASFDTAGSVNLSMGVADLPEIDSIDVFAYAETFAASSASEARAALALRITGKEFLYIDISRNAGLLRAFRRFRGGSAASYASTESIASVSVPSILGVSNTQINLRVATAGQTVQARCWKLGDAEPTSWQLTFTDIRAQSGSVGIAALKDTSGSASVTFDNFQAYYYPASPRLGPQTGNYIDAVSAAATADHGFLQERRDASGVVYTAYSYLATKATNLTIPYSGKILLPPLEPVEDDRYLANRVEVARDGGGSTVLQLEAGDLSIKDPPNGVGVYSKSLTLSLDSDLETPDQANWELYQSTWQMDRYKTVTLGLRTRALQKGTMLTDTTLKEAVQNLDVGSVIKLTELPVWLSPDDVYLLVRGYSENISLDDQRIEFNCTPFGPYKLIGQRETSPVFNKADSSIRRAPAGSVTVGSFTAGVGTSLTVNTPLGPLWSTNSADYPLDIIVLGSRLRVTAVGAPSGTQQVFTVQQAPINGVTKVLASGSAVELYAPAVRSL
jgi:hypothetical protein